MVFGERGDMAATDRSGAGDPARTLELLWREPGHGRAGRGPRQGLSTDAVVAAATALADAEGIEALTMRALAQRLGVTPMTLYTYVPGKAELLDLMLDDAYRHMTRGATAPAASWRERAEAVAHDNRALLRAHPWIASFAVVRPPLGPGLIGKYEHELGAFEGLGLDDLAMDAALTHLLAFVLSTTRAALAAEAAARAGEQSDQEWWETAGPLLARVLDPERYPLATRVGSAAGEAHGSAYSPEHAYRFGLTCVLDGLECLIGGRAPAQR
ncbi:TetR/AcrR family transcriptional regulator C-terminal domain-containing protein [Streptomyces sp. G-G2]|uniref:TetR/AcrR family transcriptional regulator n=1 Tax=Streptomyces sp. G-G2 TaxID=3046201 RepID=UPI0024BA2A8C|nr:TetR/AcrR family transcriptional regulator C-terminal domain-containing protein [Streptomyces sp. G-G2]MDJ0382719.1 TetR/AcrR family transcriptional regulator C-terminal domain-containing protein [Streptomyces sp. G-G2]